MTKATRPTRTTCARCGNQKAVGQRGPIPVYCSGACRSGEAHSTLIDIECAHCAASASVRPGSAYCSPRCRNAASYAASRADGRYDAALRQRRQESAAKREAEARPCPYCTALMLSPRAKQCGQPDCRRRFNADRMREWNRAYRKEHGAWYSRKNFGDQQRQYDRQRRTDGEHWRRVYPAAAAAADAKRRALVAQARTAEVFAPADVHARDGWTCQLCRLPIDRAVAWPDSASPSIDHVIPLSRGGAHALANVQSAHLGCNSSRGNKLIDEVIEDLRNKAKTE